MAPHRSRVSSACDAFTPGRVPRGAFEPRGAPSSRSTRRLNTALAPAEAGSAPAVAPRARRRLAGSGTARRQRRRGSSSPSCGASKPCAETASRPSEIRGQAQGDATAGSAGVRDPVLTARRSSTRTLCRLGMFKRPRGSPAPRAKNESPRGKTSLDLVKVHVGRAERSRGDALTAARASRFEHAAEVRTGCRPTGCWPSRLGFGRHRCRSMDSRACAGMGRRRACASGCTATRDLGLPEIRAKADRCFHRQRSIWLRWGGAVHRREPRVAKLLPNIIAPTRIFLQVVKARLRKSASPPDVIAQRNPGHTG